MLFSEPKIPQSRARRPRSRRCGSFSALQRAENSSILRAAPRSCWIGSFSALQRAENSSIVSERIVFKKFNNVSVLFSEPKIPQSGSAKSYNLRRRGFSALQRAENSSIRTVGGFVIARMTEFQCSSASRKFLNDEWLSILNSGEDVSVLFSEPKIPQCARGGSQASRGTTFQCSSASRKFLNPSSAPARVSRCVSFSALQRAENSSICMLTRGCADADSRFSALQRAENSSIRFA